MPTFQATISNEQMVISGDMDISTISQCKDTLVKAGLDTMVKTLDLGGIGICDTAGAQLLFALIASFRKRGANLAIVGKSSTIEHAMSDLGIDMEQLSATAKDQPWQRQS